MSSPHTVFLSLQGVTSIACVSLAINYPTVASVPHSMARGFKVSCVVAATCPVQTSFLTETHLLLLNWFAAL